MDFIEKIKEPVRTKLEELGYELVDIEFSKQYGVDNLTMFIHKTGGVSLDDCGRVHVQLDMLLDELNPIPGSYVLNISSPGLDRPLVTQTDFNRNSGNEIEIIYKTPVQGKKSIKGILDTRTDKEVTLKIKDKTINVNYDNISTVKPVINFGGHKKQK